MNKRRLFAIVLFIAVGLFMFTFANPNDRTGQNGEGNNSSETTPASDETNTNDNGNTNVLPAPNPTPVVVDLTGAKQNAIDELKNYRNDYQYTDDTKYNELINQYTDAINNSNSLVEIQNNLDEGKKAIDALILEDLNAYKNAAKEEITEYAKEVILDEAKKEEIVTEAFTNIDNAETKAEVDQIVTDTKKALDDAAKAELDAYKAEAVEKLEEHASKVVLEETKKEEIVTDGTNAINDAATKELVDEELAKAIKALDDAAKAELDAIKAAAIEELRNYKNDEKYTEENQAIVDGIKEVGIEAITNALTKEDVAEELADAKTAIDNVKVLTFVVTFKDLDGNATEVEVIHDQVVTNVPVFGKLTHRGITYKPTGWDKDITKPVTGNMTVTAKYDIVKVVVNVFMLHDGIAIPANGATAGKSNYDAIGTIELDLTKKEVKDHVNKVVSKNNTTNLIFNDQAKIESYVVGNLPKQNDKEYIYNYYVLKFEKGDGFHIDFARSKNEAPVITLDGTYYETFKKTGHFDYNKGFTVSDDHTVLTKADVKIKIVKNGHAEVGSVNYSKVGKYVIYYTVSDAEGNTTTVTRTVVVKEIKLESISATPVKASYFVGDEVSAVKVVGINNNGSTFDITEGYEVSGFKTDESGTKTATVTYEGKETTFEYTVNEVVVDSISIKTATKSYYVDDELQNVTIDVYYNNGTVVEDVLATDIDNYNTLTDGTRTATVTYEGATATFEYTVTAIEVDRIAINTAKKAYFVGETVNSVTIDIYYNNGKDRKNVVARNVDNYNTKTAGKRTATVTYEGKEATFEYVVTYSDAQLDAMFRNVQVTLPHVVHLFSEDEYYIQFTGLPVGATIEEVKREDKEAAKLTETNIPGKFSLGKTDYHYLRDNGVDWIIVDTSKPIYITYKINGQLKTLTYDEKDAVLKLK